MGLFFLFFSHEKIRKGCWVLQAAGDAQVQGQLMEHVHLQSVGGGTDRAAPCPPESELIVWGQPFCGEKRVGSCDLSDKNDLTSDMRYIEI